MEFVAFLSALRELESNPNDLSHLEPVPVFQRKQAIAQIIKITNQVCLFKIICFLVCDTQASFTSSSFTSSFLTTFMA